MPTTPAAPSETAATFSAHGRPLAGVGRRAIAQFIDMLTWYVILVVLANFAGLTQGYSPFGFDLGALGNVAALVGILAYFVVTEAAFGRTLGKALCGLVVIRQDGQPLGWTESLLRNVCRVIDAFPYCTPYLLGAGFAWNTPLRQRVGDRIGGTVVVARIAEASSTD